MLRWARAVRSGGLAHAGCRGAETRRGGAPPRGRAVDSMLTGMLNVIRGIDRWLPCSGSFSSSVSRRLRGSAPRLPARPAPSAPATRATRSAAGDGRVLNIGGSAATWRGTGRWMTTRRSSRCTASAPRAASSPSRPRTSSEPLRAAARRIAGRAQASERQGGRRRRQVFCRFLSKMGNWFLQQARSGRGEGSAVARKCGRGERCIESQHLYFLR
jgi:hypothetical protein